MITFVFVLSCPSLWFQGLGSNHYWVRNLCTRVFIAQGVVVRAANGVTDPEILHRIAYINSMLPPYFKPTIEVTDDEP